ncbi:MAG: ATP-binding cassette domain-containing protein [Fibrobacterota bacterium]
MHSLLKIQNLGISFGRKTVLSDISFDVKKKEMVNIFGANGSGKTSLIKAICGVLLPERGNINRNSRISSVISSVRGFYPKLTVKENIEFFMKVAGHKISNEDILQILGDYGISGLMDTEFQALSAGEKHKSRLGMAFLSPSELIVLDEPFRGLDNKSSETVLRHILEKCRNGGAVLYSSHAYSGMADKEYKLEESFLKKREAGA